MINRNKNERKNPETGLEISSKQLDDLIGKKIVLVLDHGYAEEILFFKNSRYRLQHVIKNEAIFSFSFERKDVEVIELFEGGRYYIYLRKP